MGEKEGGVGSTRTRVKEGKEGDCLFLGTTQALCLQNLLFFRDTEGEAALQLELLVPCEIGSDDLGARKDLVQNTKLVEEGHCSWPKGNG